MWVFKITASADFKEMINGVVSIKPFINKVFIINYSVHKYFYL